MFLMSLFQSLSRKKSQPRWLLLIALLAVLAPFAIQSGASGQGRRIPVRNNTNEAQGMQFRLSEGKEESTQSARVATPSAESLPDAATQALLNRLPALKTDGEDQKEFALRDRSLPVPRTGQTITESFPPASAAAAVETTSGPLAVLRFSPEGEVPLAPHLSVTFSQPMVAVTSVQDLEAAQVPVRLTPQPPGKWRWLGTKTLLFAPTVRFPMATNFQVEIPAGTKSATGGALAQTVRWTFATPPLKVTQFSPQGGPHKRHPLFFAAFDQNIEPAELLKHINLTGAGRTWPLRLATAEEIAADSSTRQMAKETEAGRWLAFRVAAAANETNPLPGATNFVISIERGAPSAEGPRTTNAAQTYNFSTYAPLALTEHRCGYDGKCEPGTDWALQFNNPLDVNAFEENWVRIEPAVPGAKISANYNAIQIMGATKGRTTYRVTIAASVKDTFGQTLGQEKTVTFNVGSAQPNLATTDEGMTVLDPYGAARFSVYSINHQQLKISLYAVTPDDWEAFTTFMREEGRGWVRRGGRPTIASLPFGRQVSSQIVNVKAQPDALADTQVELKPALSNNLGHVIVIAEAVQPARSDWERRWTATWVQVTGIGLDAFTDHSQMLAWATSLKDGKPLNDVQLSINSGKTAESLGKTAADGTARLALPASSKTKLLIARKGNDLAFLPESDSWWGGNDSWSKRALGDGMLRWHIFDDRGMYRPGEEARLKGWVRRIGTGPRGDVSLVPNLNLVGYVLRDSRGNEVLKGAARVNALGGFDTSLKLPPNMNLGMSVVELRVPGMSNAAGSQTQHYLRVQEFRRPEFEVKAQASEGPHFIGQHAILTATANYYAGGALPNAEVHWNVTATPTRYTPPNRADFSFGKWTAWWMPYNDYTGGATKSFAARTDAAGKHHLRIDFDSVSPAQPASVSASVNVQDVNRQMLSAATTLLVHPSDLYVGLRSPRNFVQQGEPLIVETIASDIDGKLIANREIRIRAVLLDWVFDKGQWRERETNLQECVVKSGDKAATCRFETKEGGRYRILASIYDDRERLNESELMLWVAGGKQLPQRDLSQEKVELIPNLKEYQPGQTAEILVQAPFFPAEGVLTLRREGLVSSERFTMISASHTLKIPLLDEYVPNLHVQVDLVGAATRTDNEGKADSKLPKRPAFAAGELNLGVSLSQRKLTVAATPRDKALEPGGETAVTLQVKDTQGRPVSGSEVAVVVVDEAVLALSNYQLADPLNSFYYQRGPDVADFHLRKKVELSDPAMLISQMKQGGGGGVAGAALKSVALEMAAPAAPRARMAMAADASAGEPDTPIRARLDFNALAFFAGSLPTDEQGRATVQVKLPDNLTRYRVMAVAAAGSKQFGTGESAITARLPLMVRPSAPRFLNFGDRFEMPVVIQNQTDNPLDVSLAVRASNAQLTAGQGRRITVPANDRVEVRFPTTTLKPGTARFQFAATSGKWADAAEISLPVWTPATTEAFATYGEIDAGAIAQPIKAPSDAFKQFGGLEITTSSTQLQALTDAVLYLTTYPYDCAEQVASRLLAIASLRDVLAAFDAAGLPPADQLLASVERDLKRLQGLQNADGGFGFWRRNDESWPYLSIHVALALQRAKDKKFDVPGDMLTRSQQYLRTVEQHIPGWYSLESRRALIAFALNVRTRMGDRDLARARRLIDEAGTLNNLPLEAVGWLLPVFTGAPGTDADTAAIRRHLLNRAEETAGAAHFTTSYSDGAQVMLHSSRRADGIILDSLIGDDPKNDLIPKIVRGLLAHRKAGRWENTQENAFVLLALDRYFNTYEKTTPDFIARAWLGDAFAGSHEFRGRSTDRSQLNVPMSYLMSNASSAQNLTLSKEGAGRLYYRIGMNYAPTSLTLKPADYGFTVLRVYEAIDDPNDVRRLEDGTWRIKAGAKVRVRLSLIATARRYHVALVDPLPAGLEALNPELAITGRLPQDPKDQTSGNWWWRWWQWFEHQNMRDERVEAFTSLLWEGVYNYSYVARATTPGNFVVPPTKAEEMYHPETFGRSASDRVVIE